MATPQSSATKSPNDFTGKGEEIIGNPHEIGGEIIYQDGSIAGIIAAQSPASTPPTVPTTKEAAWLNLSRKNKADLDPSNRADRNDMITAGRLGEEFAKAILDGTAHTFSRAIVKQSNSITENNKAKEHKRKKRMGYEIALYGIALKTSHPKELTIQAVKDFIDANREGFKPYDFGVGEIPIRSIERDLKAMGFGWLKRGTQRRGRPTGSTK